MTTPIKSFFVTEDDYDFYPKNKFMPKCPSSQQLPEKVIDFLDLYVPFAKSMQNLVDFQASGISRRSPPVIKEKNDVIVHAIKVAKYLLANPCIKQTAEMAQFLTSTSEKISKTLEVDLKEEGKEESVLLMANTPAKNAKVVSQLQHPLSCTNSMILASVRARSKLTYPDGP